MWPAWPRPIANIGKAACPSYRKRWSAASPYFEKECVSDVGEYNKKAADKLSTIIALVSYEASKDAIKGLLGKCVVAGISLLVYANSLDSVDEETKSLTTLLE